MRRIHRFAVVGLLISAGAFSIDDPVRVSTGALSGAPGASAEVRVYKGIPFAQPPVGDLRWRAPKPPASWEGVRAAKEFSAICPQQPYPSNSMYYSAPQPTSEDCLYLNVWTAVKSATERRPVMVWIHGGSLTRGSGSTPTYDGEELAKKGAIVVTINYRLGVLGFLAHPELTKESDRNASGNYGILDQIAALEWVRTNIAAFGGDPGRVTIFGESAGSWSVNLLMATPLARGLFHRVIGESGASFTVMPKLLEAEKSGAQFATSIGAGSLQALRAKSADDLLKASASGSFRPNVDGWMLPEDVYTIFTKGKQNDVPLIAGFNADEGTTLAPWPSSGTAVSFAEQIRRRFGNQAEPFLKIYPASSDEEAKSSYYASFRDQAFAWQMRTWARMSTRTGKSKAYLYNFTRVPPGLGSDRYGSFHAAEIAYVFHNLHPGRRHWEDTDRKLSDAMASYWVNFAATGNPNGPGLPKWPEYSEKSDPLLDLGDTIQTRAGVHKQGLDFFDDYFASLRKKP